MTLRVAMFLVAYGVFQVQFIANRVRLIMLSIYTAIWRAKQMNEGEI